MTTPSAIVAVELREIRNIPTSPDHKRLYARAFIDDWPVGRSRVIARGSTSYSLGGEPEPWRRDARPIGSAPVRVVVEVWDDRDDAAPVRVARIDETIAAPYAAGQLTLGAPTEVVCDVTTTLVPPEPRAFVARGGAAGRVAGQGTQPALVVELTRIKGLYKPRRHNDRPKRSIAVEGYTSDDHRGRIFLNRDLDGRYQRDTQQLHLAVRVHARRGQIPAGTKVVWRVEDPDETFDQQPSVHRDWTPYIDAGDYDAGGSETGARSGDNEGRPDKNPRWDEVAPYALSDASATGCKTVCVGARSEVILHAPNVAGDNMVVRAGLEAPGAEIHEARTGIMTLWHLVDVEHLVMPGAGSLDVSMVADALEPACVELRFEEAKPAPLQDPMAPSDAALEDHCRDYARVNFSRRNTPGWFLLVAGRRPYVSPPPPATPLAPRAPVAIHRQGNDQYVVIPGAHLNAETITFYWGGHRVQFALSSVQALGANTAAYLVPLDVQRTFTAGDGSERHAYEKTIRYLPHGRIEDGRWVDGGYRMPATVEAEIYGPTVGYRGGISPLTEVGGQPFFAGEAFVFMDTYTGTFSLSAVQVATHELVHALGMPHKCGYYDYVTPRETSCCLNYPNDWLVDSRHEPIAGSARRVGSRLCGRHLKELRRLHLEDNPALRDRGW